MTPPAVDVRNLCKTFVQGEASIDVLKGINLQLTTGDTVAILGQSGSGKSTLLSLLAGLDQPSSGSIHMDGRDITTLSEQDLAVFRARTLGIVFQQFHLMSNLTALENVTLPLELAKDPAALEKGREALEKVGLSARSSHFPSQLSGGERQRVALARAFVVQPKLLLADEPSGNLDTRTGLQVVQLLFDLVESRKTTLILVTHNDELARRCRRQLHLVDGTFS
jgi:putative ABC transport system ATP-binding protein